MFTKIGQMMGHKTNLIHYYKSVILQNVFSDFNRMKLGINKIFWKKNPKFILLDNTHIINP